MKYIFVIIFPILLLSGCGKNEDLTRPCTNDQLDFDPNQMNLVELKAGQKFRYLLLTAKGYHNPDSTNFKYTGDTLELEVLQADQQKYLVSEKITKGSKMMSGNYQYYWGSKDSIFINNWIIRNDSLIFGTRNGYLNSHLLFMDGSGLSLLEFKGKEVQITGWKTSYPYTEGDVKLFTKNDTLLGNCYTYLNVYINNKFMQVDGPGNTTIYSKEYGIIRTSIYSWWTSDGIGWDKL